MPHSHLEKQCDIAWLLMINNIIISQFIHILPSFIIILGKKPTFISFLLLRPVLWKLIKGNLWENKWSFITSSIKKYYHYNNECLDNDGKDIEKCWAKPKSLNLMENLLWWLKKLHFPIILRITLVRFSATGLLIFCIN